MRYITITMLGLLLFGVSSIATARTQKVFVTYCYTSLNPSSSFGGKPTTHNAATSYTKALPPGSVVTLVKFLNNGHWQKWQKHKRSWRINDLTAHAPYRRNHLALINGKKFRFCIPTLDIYVTRRNNPVKEVSGTICLVSVKTKHLGG